MIYKATVKMANGEVWKETIDAPSTEAAYKTARKLAKNCKPYTWVSAVDITKGS